jgi:hypothetical protein
VFENFKYENNNNWSEVEHDWKILWPKYTVSLSDASIL